MRLGLVLVVGTVLAAAPAAAQEREVEIGPAGASIYESPEGGAAQLGSIPAGTHARPLSRQWGFYKVRVGSRVGWIRASDTSAPMAPGAAIGTARPAVAKKPPRAARPATPAPTAAAPAPTAPAPADAADGGAPAEAAAAAPARPAAPLVPPLRLAWPPPLQEWVATTRTWADAAGPTHLGVAGALTLLAVLAAAYGGYRLLKWLVLLPVRALRAVGRAIGRAAKRRRAAPPKVRAEVAARLSEIEGLTAAVQAAGPTGVSLHESYVAAGADDCAITAFAEAVARTESPPEFPGWLAVLTDDDPVTRDNLARAWLLEVVRARAQSWLDLHPLFGGRGLRAEREEGEQASDIAFQFVSPDGLGVTLDEEQQRAALFLTTAIERARVHLPNAYAVADFARALAAAAAGPDAPSPPAAVPSLATLLFGPGPHENAGSFADGAAVSPEVKAAVELHRRSGKDLCEGPALYAAANGAAPGVGAVLVAALSGAMSASSATLKLRQALAQALRGAVAQASAGLAPRVGGWIAGRERAMLVAAVERALGRDVLDAALARAEALRKMHGRDLAQDAQKLLGRWHKVSLPEALLQAHVGDLGRVRAAVGAAAGRYVDFIAALLERTDDLAAQAAAGYLCAGLGAGAFADAPDATRVLIAEAARPLRRNVEGRRSKVEGVSPA